MLKIYFVGNVNVCAKMSGLSAGLMRNVFCIFKFHFPERGSFRLQPFFVAEEGEHGREGGGHDEHDEEKIKVGVVEGEEDGVHSPDAGQESERHEDHREKSENFDYFVHFHRDQNVVGFFEGFDGFFGAFERVLHAAVRAVKHHKIVSVILAIKIDAAGAQ